MSEYHFLSGTGKAVQARKIDEVCRRHGCSFVSVRLPDGWRHWASGPNLGFPFDREMERSVRDDLTVAGLLDEDGRVRTLADVKRR